MVFNIVCFHGFTQNSDILKKKLKNLVKSNKDIILHFMDGTIILSSGQDLVQQQRAYWIYDKENPLNVIWENDHKPETKLYFLEDSLKAFIDLGNSIGNVDGLIGFSQGGCFADYICKLHSKGEIKFDIKFAIFISGKHFEKPEYGLDTIKPTLETLHIHGSDDTIITPKMSELLEESYTNKEIFVHKGAHVIPSSSAAKTTFKNFITKCLHKYT